MLGARCCSLVIALLLLTTGLLSLGARADIEPNDGFATAETISAGTYDGAMDGSTDYEDYYRFTVSAGDVISVSLNSTSNGLTMYLYDEDESWLAEVDGTPMVTEYLWYHTAAETEYVTCYLTFETDGAVDYSFTLSIGHQNDGGSVSDASSERSNALVVTEGTLNGEVNSGSDEYNDMGEDDMDCYKFWAGTGDRISLSFTTGAPDYLYLNLVDPEDDFIFQDLRERQGGTVSEEWWTANETLMGWYYLEVYQDMTPGQYTITLDIERQNEYESGKDAPVLPQYGLVISSGSFNGHLEDDDRVDCFKFQAGEGDVISIGFRGYSEGDNIYFDLLNEMESTIGSDGSGSSDSGVSMQFYTASETPVQTYHLKVWIDTAPGNYMIELGIEKQNDAGLGMDVLEGGNIGSSPLISTGSYEGSIYDLDTADTYMINLSAGDILYLTLSISEGESASWRLFDDTLTNVLNQGIGFMEDPSRSTYYFDSMLGPLTCFLKIYNGQVRYSLGIAISQQNDAASGTDAPGTASAAQLSEDPLPIGAGTYTGLLDTRNDLFDSYLIDMTGGHRLTVEITPDQSLGISAMLYGSEVVQFAMDTMNGPGETAYLQYDFGVDEWAQLMIQLYSGSGNYSFTVTITDIPSEDVTPTAPTLTASSGSTGITLTWTEPDSNGGSPITLYRVYRGTNPYGNLLLLETLDASIQTYIDYSAVEGVTYYYEVAAVNDIGEGASSSRESASISSPTDDTDGDGMPDDWEDLYELDKLDPSDADDDPDDDGLTNLEEYGMGRNPRFDETGGDDDDDLTEEEHTSWLVGLPFIIAGVCGVLLLIIIIVVVIIVVVASRKKKASKDDEE
ncbi:MAG: fibronectin type III domain-containing protein [Candidatus Thermoplasmatota archaeon]|nr:fibronectin type III domain-containing protein [Candidatus Thermoplasmatota archaeon]